MSFQNAIANPTIFPRSVEMEMPFPGGMTNGVQPNFGEIGSQFGATTLHDKAKIFTALNANWRVVHHWFRDEITFVPQQSADKALIWSTTVPSRVADDKFGPEHRQYAISYLNYLNKHDRLWIRHYGQETTSDKAMRDLQWAGIQQGEPKTDTLPGHPRVQNHIVGHRARTHLIWAALKYSNVQRGTVEEMDTAWIIPMKLNLEPDFIKGLDSIDPSKKRVAIVNQAARNQRMLLERADNNNAFEAMRREQPVSNFSTYWSLEPFISTDNQAPHPGLYNSEGDYDDETGVVVNHWSSTPIRIGKITAIHGDIDMCEDLLSKARKALHPDKNNEDWKKLFYTLPECDIMLRVG